MILFQGTLSQLKPFIRNINIIVIALDVKLPMLQANSSKNLEIESFEDECSCISKLLSIKDKHIYFAVSASVGEFVIPLMHKHRCLENIYVYQDTNDTDMTWINEYSKVAGNGSSMDLLAVQIGKDIDSIMQRPSRWSRSKTLLTELSSQTSDAALLTSIKDTHKEDVNTLRIITLFFGTRGLFSRSQSQIKVDEFDDVEACLESIRTIPSITIFLVVSVNGHSNMHFLFDLDNVHAIYIIPANNYDESIEKISMHSKVSGVFGFDEDLLDQLTRDICFYRHVRSCTPMLNAFQIGCNIIENPDLQQINFLCFQLFTTILPELPTQLNATAEMKAEHISRLLSLLIDANMNISDLLKQFDRSALHKYVSGLQEFNQRVMALPKSSDSSSSLTVYRAQLVSKKDLQTIRENPQALLSIPTFILASRSFRTISSICRRAADNQLTVNLFELKLSDDILRAELDTNIIVFGLGTLFRLVSIESTPDGVWRTQLESADRATQRINRQLNLEIGGHLTWLTFGNYLTALKRFSAAEEYYNYLLEVLPSNHPSLASIYNNIGLMYSMKKNDQEALIWFEKALKLDVSNSSMPTVPQNSEIGDEPSLQYVTMDRVSILSKLGALNYHQGNRSEALNYYRQALEISTDVSLRLFFEARIEAILSSSTF